MGEKQLYDRFKWQINNISRQKTWTWLSKGNLKRETESILKAAQDHRINLKECEKKDKYIDFARELKKLWNMKVTIVPIVIGASGTITKGWLKGLEDLEVDGR